MIEVMREARDEWISIGRRRNLHQRNPAAGDQIPQQRDVQFQGGNAGVRGRLPIGEEHLNFSKHFADDGGRLHG